MKRRYQPHPALLMEERSRAKLLASTGKSFEEWVALAKRQKIVQQPKLRAWLSSAHALGSRYAWWIASAACSPDATDYDEPERLVEELYAGSKAAWRPLHEALVDEFLKLGKDVLVTACKTMVPIYRKYVFAELKPMARGVQVRLATGQANGNDRLHAKFLIKDRNEIDAALRRRLQAAYVQGAEQVARQEAGALPPEFAQGLKSSRAAAATWAQCTAAMQRDMLEWIRSAKQEATRTKRTGVALTKLAEGKRRVY